MIHQSAASVVAAAGAHQIIGSLLPLAKPAATPAALTPAHNKTSSHLNGSSTSKKRSSSKKIAATTPPVAMAHGGGARVPANCMKVQNRKQATVVKMLRAVIPAPPAH
jgi:hypothetical protein